MLPRLMLCRYAFKPADYRDFYVNHLSHWDHGRSERDVARMSGAAARECADLNPIPHEPLPSSGRPWSSVALVPFWGGSAEASGGNSHSQANHENKVSSSHFVDSSKSQVKGCAPGQTSGGDAVLGPPPFSYRRGRGVQRRR
jgi:hypothetical protein